MMRLLAALCAGVLAAVFWHHWLQPWVYLENLDLQIRGGGGPSGMSKGVDAVVSLGPRAVPQIVARIGKYGRSKSAALLPSALRRIGEPGRIALLKAIDREGDSWRRLYYVAALIQGYGDFSRVHHWIDHLRDHPHGYGGVLRVELDRRFGETPPEVMTKSREINPAFLAWYDARTKPKGPLPPLE
jgi:hypothetical protein